MTKKVLSDASLDAVLETALGKKKRGRPKKIEVKPEESLSPAWRAAAEATAKAEAFGDEPGDGAKIDLDTGKKPIEACGFVEWLDQNGQELEPGQRVLALVMLDRVDPIDLVGEEQKIALAMFGCERIPAAARASGLLLSVCGGRGGKSLIAAWRLVFLAATIELKLSPGEQAYAPIIAPDARLSEQVLRYAEGIARVWFPLKGRVVEDSSAGFTLIRNSECDANDEKNRVRFVIWPATVKGKSLRGRALVGGVIDESAFLRGEDAAVSDKGVIDALTPRVMMGGELMLVTTPDAEEGESYELFKRNFGHPDDAVVAHAPTWVLRTDAKILAQVAREKKRNPWNYEREFGARFVKNKEGMFFDRVPLETCTIVKGAA